MNQIVIVFVCFEEAPSNMPEQGIEELLSSLLGVYFKKLNSGVKEFACDNFKHHRSAVEAINDLKGRKMMIVTKFLYNEERIKECAKLCDKTLLEELALTDARCQSG